MANKINQNKSVETIVHEDAKRKNIPTQYIVLLLEKEEA